MSQIFKFIIVYKSYVNDLFSIQFAIVHLLSFENCFFTYLFIIDVFPTDASPNKTTLKLYIFFSIDTDASFCLDENFESSIIELLLFWFSYK